MSEYLLGVFAKFWSPGQVKTRLGAEIGMQRSADLYRCFVRTLLRRFEGIADRRLLAFTPQENQADFAAMAGDGWELTPQADGDLGERMAAFFESAFRLGIERVVLIGSDSPTLPARYLEQAFQALADYHVVLGPSEDGGYYLVGAKGQVPPIFEHVDWSTGGVWEQTIRQLELRNAPFAVLAPWYDVDTYDDLLRLRSELVEGGNPQGCVEGLLEAIHVAIDDSVKTD